MKTEKLILIDDLEIYQLAMGIGDEIWNLADTWDYWKKDTIGKQLVKRQIVLPLIFLKAMEDILIKTEEISATLAGVLCLKHVHGLQRQGTGQLLQKKYLNHL